MPKSVSFNKEVLSLIDELASINTAIKIYKEDNKIFIKSQNPSESIAYILSTEVTSFDFDGDEIAFYNYSDFYKWVSALNVTEMNQREDGMLQLGNGRQKGQYQSSDVDVVRGGRFEIEFEDPDATFNLSSENIKELQKLRSLVAKDNNNVKFTFDGRSAHVEIYNNDTANNVETELELTTTVEESFSIRLADEFLSTIPGKYSYRVDIKKEGIARFSMNNDFGVDVEIFIAEVEE